MNKSLLEKLIPNSLDDIVGQEHLLNENGLIRKIVEKNKMFSMIFFGLPGTGKSSLAQVICKQMKIDYGFYNPTKDKKEVLISLIQRAIENDKDFVIIIDEIHRMNKDKQDILLSYLEFNHIFIIGSTTENPYFVINPAIRSRCQIIQFHPLTYNNIKNYLIKIKNKFNIQIDDEALNLICQYNSSDLRSALNVFNIIYLLYNDQNINLEIVKKVLQNPIAIGSSYGDEFYNLQSAFHKSLRGSDIDASIYYLARLIKIGDLSSISRRMIAMAYEDIGLANPSLISRIILGINSAERLGFPEANQILSSLVIEMCLSPKSNSAYMAITLALNDIDNGLGNLDIPNNLKDTRYKSTKKMGYENYKNPHHFKNNWIKQDYLPKEIINKKYYHPNDNEIENKMNKSLNQRKQIKTT